MVHAVVDNPMLSVNAKLWQFLSVLFARDWRRCVALVAPVCLMNAMQFVYLYQQWGDLATFILNTFFAVSVFNALLRTCFIIKNRDKFEALMEELVTLYDDIQDSGDDYAKSVLTAATKSARNISIFNFSASVSDLVVAMTFPLFQQQRVHPFGVALPGIDVTRSPLYELIYIGQLSFPFTLSSMYMPYVSSFATFSMFGKAALQILQNNLRNLCDNMKSKTEEELFGILRKNIAYHARIARYLRHLLAALLHQYYNLYCREDFHCHVYWHNAVCALHLLLASQWSFRNEPPRLRCGLRNAMVQL
uniref:Olfactory receptor n=1 Tax=Bactrocera latifrons TaxID=174628 RepID=A0A5H2WZY7_BACLA